jgi:hypothetical protein
MRLTILLSTGQTVLLRFNPRNGLAQVAGEYEEKSKMQFTPPDRNDWVLVIDDAIHNFPKPGGN